MKTPEGYRWERPRALPVLVVTLAVLTLIGLGLWQVQRLKWKEELIQQIADSAKIAPITVLPHEKADVAKLNFRRIALKGEFLNDHEFHLASRYHRDVLGYHILTPFKLDDGRIVVLNRGWVPFDQKLPKTRPQGLIAGSVSLVAMVRADNDRNPFTPNAVPEKNLWFWKDIEGMKKASGLALEPISLDVLDMKVPGDAPLSLDGNIMLKNDHLGYAITWFSLALAAIVIFLLVHLKPENEP